MPTYQNTSPPPGTVGKSGWTIPLRNDPVAQGLDPQGPFNAITLVLSATPLPGGTPISDGLPSGPPVPGGDPNGLTGLNPFGPQPVTGWPIGATVSGSMLTGGMRIDLSKVATINQAAAWWATQPAGGPPVPGLGLPQVTYNPLTGTVGQTPTTTGGGPTPTNPFGGAFDMGSMMAMMGQMMQLSMQMSMMKMMMSIFR